MSSSSFSGPTSSQDAAKLGFITFCTWSATATSTSSSCWGEEKKREATHGPHSRLTLSKLCRLLLFLSSPCFVVVVAFCFARHITGNAACCCHSVPQLSGGGVGGGDPVDAVVHCQVHRARGLRAAHGGLALTKLCSLTLL